MSIKSIESKYKEHRFRNLVLKKIACDYVVISPFGVQRHMDENECKKYMRGLNSARLPSILEQCENESEASRILSFAATIALHTGSPLATEYAARLALKMRGEPKKLETIEGELAQLAEVISAPKDARPNVLYELKGLLQK